MYILVKRWAELNKVPKTNTLSRQFRYNGYLIQIINLLSINKENQIHLHTSNSHEDKTSWSTQHDIG